MTAPKTDGGDGPLPFSQNLLQASSQAPTQTSSQDPPQDLNKDLSHNKPERLFFALWPDDALRQQLISRSKPLVETVRGRPVSDEKLHITLVFLGDTDTRQRDCLESMATRVAEEFACLPFKLTLDRFGHWSRSRVLWFGSIETPEPLTLLVDRLSAGARECGLSLDARPYRAHLTLMRKVSRMPEKLTAASLDPLSWPVNRFALVRSVPVPQGVYYEVLQEWRLRASAED
jgi:2'-5' RNA ligase